MANNNGGGITDETIKWAYRLFLGREVEDQNVIDFWLNHFSDIEQLKKEFANADEFIQHYSIKKTSMVGNEPSLDIELVNDVEPLMRHINDVWHHLGQSEPYWSVITESKYLSSTIAQTQDDFFESGQESVDLLIKTFERNNIDSSKYRSCLEFGCGLGRITFWLAKKFEIIFGYDISKPHLDIAQQYLDLERVKNVTLCHINKLDDMLKFPKVDLVYTILVLQHNPPPLIKIIVESLLKSLNPGGIAYFQVLTYRKGYQFNLNDYMQHEAKKQEMELHVLPQHIIFDIVDKNNCKVIEVLEDNLSGLYGSGDRSNTFIVQKKPEFFLKLYFNKIRTYTGSFR